MPPLRILFDGDPFVRHFRSGMTRYFSELIAELEADETFDVVPVTPFRYISNEHLSERMPGRYRRIPLPRGWRAPVLSRLNSRAERRCGAANIVHHGSYDPALFDRWSAPVRVCTVYDFTFELLPELHPHVAPHLRDKKFYLENCDALMCISQTTRDDLRHLHPELDKPTFVTPLGVSEKFLAPRRESIRGLPERYVLHVGNRYKHKNVDVLLRAFAEIAPRDPTLYLVLSGAGLPDETARLDELGIAARTVRLRVSDAQLPWLYRCAEVFVFPSLYEGFGLPVLEAMAAGCAIAISDTPSLIEVASDAALAFPPEHVETLASHLEKLLHDPDARQRLRANGMRRAADFSWRRTAELTAAAYEQAARA